MIPFIELVPGHRELVRDNIAQIHQIIKTFLQDLIHTHAICRISCELPIPAELIDQE